MQTSVGPIQFGILPETIKDSMKLGLEVPTYFVAPTKTFTTSLGHLAGINVAEFEFPAYFNFFIKKKKVVIICDGPQMEARFRAVFQETLLGPQTIDSNIDFDPRFPKEQRPDLRAEMDFFAKFGQTRLSVDLLIDFYQYTNNELTLTKTKDDGTTATVILRRDTEYIEVKDGNLAPLAIPNEVKLPPLLEKDIVPLAFKPPLFGVTVLGSSHGFDPSGSTSGYVLWVNGKGVMIDPPPNSTNVLKENHIYPSMITGVIITHCHADHDAGTFQKLLQEGRVTLITTPTIFESFCRKYSALSGLDINFLKQIFRFKKVLIGQPLHLRGAVFNFFYSLHSIPCIGFEVSLGSESNKKSIVFSADHMNDPAAILRLKEEGVISEARCNELLNFPWHHDIILHESGVPPIHTPMATLAALPDDVKKRLYVVHTTNSQVPKDKGLKAALTGVENTLTLEVDVELSEVMQVLDLVSAVVIFKELNVEHASELLQIYNKKSFVAGEIISKAGSIGDEFYVILSGMVEVSVPNGENVHQTIIKPYYPGDYFGEQTLISDDFVRTSDTVAKTDVEVIYFHKADFLRLVGGTSILSRFEHIRDARNFRTWSDIRKNSKLKLLSPNQITQLQEIIEVDVVKTGEVIWNEGDEADIAVIVGADCKVILKKEGVEETKTLGRGVFICDVDAMRTFRGNEYTLECAHGGQLLKIFAPDLLHFFTENPGFLISVLGTICFE